jgi:hypothetical protein
MKLAFAFLATLLVFGSVAMASPTTCANTTLDVYITGGYSCVSGNLLFSNFTYTDSANPAGVAIPATGISVKAETVTGDEGFQFSSGWSVGTQSGGVASFQDSLITFTVSTVNHAATLDDLELSFNGDFTGTGLSRVNESYCPGGAVGAGCPGGTQVRQVTNPPTMLDDSVVFAHPVSTLGVSKDITVNSGTYGTAGISQVFNTFSNTSSVPEPATCMMLGGSLFGLGLLRRKVRKS